MQTIITQLDEEELSILISLLKISISDLGEDLNKEEGVLSNTGASTLLQLYRSIKDLSERLIDVQESSGFMVGMRAAAE